MKALFAGLFGGLLNTRRTRVIAVFGTTRREVERGIQHAQTSRGNLPIWAWCGESCDEDGGEISGCARLVFGASAHRFQRDLRLIWPALFVVAWTGRRGHTGLKLLPMLVPPFRVVVFNEADGFFALRPAPVAIHIKRRVRDSTIARARRLADLTLGAMQRIWRWLQGLRLVCWSLLWRAGERIRDAFNWAGELLLAFLAFVAQPAAPISQAAVCRARSGKRRAGASQLALKESRSGGSVDVVIPSRAWPRRAILRAAASTDAEFLVFRMRGELASAAPLISIARETGAFAVARQSAHAAWRNQAVTKHPFRRLQEGEVSQVFAPFSSLIVVRRRTLVRVGIPRALTYGGALLILFWKCSVAGLRSLVVGHEEPVTDEPAMALEDGELALRLTISPSLAALGPAHPSRFRGNIAWSPRHHVAPARAKLRVLVVSPYLPFPLTHGGAVRIYNLCRTLSRDVDFVLACFREAGETVAYEELHEVFREVYIVDTDEKSADHAVPKQVAEYRNTAMADLIRSLCLDRSVDLVQLEYTQLAEYRDDTGAVPVILVEHDITFTLYRQLAEFEGTPRSRAEYGRWLEFERMALQCSSLVWTMSAEERAVALDHGATRQRTRVIPNGVDLNRFKPTPLPTGQLIILFIGSFRHLPNLLAFEALRTAVMPAVWRDFPSAVLHVIAGPSYERAAELAGKMDLLRPDPQILLDGFVRDVRPAYRAATVVAVPLPLSAGTNIKLLEAMACGRAIVSTAAGCRGLDLTDGEELVIAGLEDFPAALVRVLKDEGLRARLAREARRVAERRFGWDSIGEEALSSYTELTGIQVGPERTAARVKSAQHTQSGLQFAPGVVVAHRPGDFDATAV